MKKLSRTNPGIDYVKLLAEHAKKKGISEYTEHAIREFGDDVQRNLIAAIGAEHRVRGLRAEALFIAVVTGIGKVKLIKAEDSGDVYYRGTDLYVPDFRVVTAEHAQMLVEVKLQPRNGNPRRPLKLADGYVTKLRKYAEQTATELRFAIFWERMGLWTLNSLEAFAAGTTGKKQWSIDFVRALAANEMALLGDSMIATTAPLCLRILIDPNKSDAISPGKNGSFKAVLAGVQLLSGDQMLRGLAAQIAWRLIWYGNWVDVGQEPHYENDRLLWIDHLLGPLGWGEHEHEHQPEPGAPVVIGALSEMISNAYMRGAERTIHTNAKDGVLQPGYVGNLIPEDFVERKLDLPLWIFHQRPNFQFGDSGSRSET